MKSKKLLLGVTGSIAAYKTLDIVRAWVNQGHQVKVILTKGAQKFLVPSLFRYLGAEEVYTADDDFRDDSNSRGASIPHIELARWCDRLIVAPLSANTMSKFAHGICDDLLTTLYLALDHKPVILYPAMNTNMLLHPTTQENLNRLGQLPFIFIHPSEEGKLACGDFGQGKLPSIEVISELAPIIAPKPCYRTRHILITTGATLSILDPVRFLTNPSSGITGYFLAKQLLSEGHKVTLIAGRNAVPQIDYLRAIPSATVQRVTTTQEMHNAVMAYWSQADVYVGGAAPSDFEFNPSSQKIKRSELGTTGHLEYVPAVDILFEVLQKKQKHQLIIGFAAESQITNEIIREKLRRKPVDLLVANIVDSGFLNNQGKMVGFGAGDNRYYFIEREGTIPSDKNLSKEELSQELSGWIDKNIIYTKCD